MLAATDGANNVAQPSTSALRIAGFPTELVVRNAARMRRHPS
jgi:hypothetical protein